MGVVQRRLLAGKPFCRYYGCRASNANIGEALFSGDGASWYFRCQVANSTCCVTTVHYPASLGCLVLNARSKWFRYRHLFYLTYRTVPYRTVYSGFRDRVHTLFYSQQTVRHTPKVWTQKNKKWKIASNTFFFFFFFFFFGHYQTTRTEEKYVRGRVGRSPINATIHDFGCRVQADSCSGSQRQPLTGWCKTI